MKEFGRVVLPVCTGGSILIRAHSFSNLSNLPYSLSLNYIPLSASAYPFVGFLANAPIFAPILLGWRRGCGLCCSMRWRALIYLAFQISDDVFSHIVRNVRVLVMRMISLFHCCSDLAFYPIRSAIILRFFRFLCLYCFALLK